MFLKAIYFFVDGLFFGDLAKLGRSLFALQIEDFS